MNFEFVRDCGNRDAAMAPVYEAIYRDLVRAEECYWEEPQQCGIILREVALDICRAYDSRYEVGFGKDASLEGFLCYTADEEHNVMVSRFLSVVRKDQRDHLNRLRVLGDDCVLGRDGADEGMSFEERMEKNARHMMEAMVETMKEMCVKISGAENLEDVGFREEALPPRRIIESGEEQKKKTLLDRIFRRG